MLTRAEYGHSVAAHYDEVKKSDKSEIIQFMFFIRGSNPPNSGELCILSDNEWREVLLRPDNLNNSLLIFDKQNNLYHGFNPLMYRKYRYAIGATFRVPF